jgi:Xaa-Pro aminopeptidase
VAGFQDSLYPALPVFAQNLACTWAGWRRARMRFTPHFHRTLAAWEKSSAGPATALHAIQKERLFRLAERARRHVPYYRDLPPPCDARDPGEAIARTLEAWPKLEKATYRDRCDEFIALEHLLHDLRLYKSRAEVVSMRRAAAVAVKAHLRAMALCRPGLYEYEIEAELLGPGEHERIERGGNARLYAHTEPRGFTLKHLLAALFDSVSYQAGAKVLRADLAKVKGLA